MEAVQRPLVHLHVVVDPVLLERGLVVGPHGVDARVVARVDDEEGGLDPADVLARGRGAVEGHAGLQVGPELHREAVGHAAAPAEAGGAELPVRGPVGLEVARAVDHVLVEARRLEAPLQRAAVVVVAGVAADRRQSVRRQGEEAGDAGAPCDVLDVRVQAAVLVDDDHGRERPVARRLHQVPAHRPGRAARRVVLHVVRRDAGVGERDRLRLGVARHERLRHPEGGDAADGERGATAQELPAVDVAVAVLVVEVEDARVDRLILLLRFRLLLFCHWSAPWFRGRVACPTIAQVPRITARRG